METLTAWRERHNLTVAEAAKKAGVTRATWWRWEQGVRAVGADSLLKIERITGISRHELRPDLSRIFVEPTPSSQEVA